MTGSNHALLLLPPLLLGQTPGSLSLLPPPPPFLSCPSLQARESGNARTQQSGSNSRGRGGRYTMRFASSMRCVVSCRCCT